jgi:hypothetical protein
VLLPGDEDTIQRQIDYAEEKIAEELAQHAAKAKASKQDTVDDDDDTANLPTTILSASLKANIEDVLDVSMANLAESTDNPSNHPADPGKEANVVDPRMRTLVKLLLAMRIR